MEAIKHSNVTCLIVEDNPVNQHLMEAMLSQKGIKSKIAENGQIALDEIKTGTLYDIVFMDINMPVMNGIDATHEIIKYEEENNIPHTPIVALTANAVAGDKEKFLSEGMDDYIPKPFEEHMLDAVLNKYINLKNEKKLESNTEVEDDIVDDNEEFVYSIEDTAKSLGLGLPIFKTILKTFFTSIDKDLEKLKESIEEKDFEKIKGAAHKIKGAAGNLKINNVFEITKEIELSAKDEFDINYIKKYDKLLNCVKDIKKVYEDEA